ncbi:MAG: NAD-binding protein [Actinobacteria bacterium]|nr:NAD-binding protein [Actinomycetota bacterium]
MKSTAAAPVGVALLGWGRMGGPMGTRLIEGGHNVVAYDTSENARRAARSVGAQLAPNAAAAVRSCSVVITMLPTPGAVDEVARGEDGVLAGLQPGALWLEMSSSHPSITMELSESAAQRGAGLLDAPVSGGVKGAQEGRLTIIVGGQEELLQRARPLLGLLGGQIIHVGDRPGDGDLAKTINNMLSAINLTAAAEGMAMARAGGLDFQRLVEVLNCSTGASNATEVKIPNFVLTKRFDAGFTIANYLKDMRIALDLCSNEGVAVELLSAVHVLWTAAVAQGHADDDHTMMVPFVARRSGRDLDGPDSG